jgi:hypothetical protein
MTPDPGERPKIPVAQVAYGEIVYWITIVASLVCMIGPLVAVADPEGNLLNPHYVFARIFAGEEPAGVWALSAKERPRLPVGLENVPGPADREELDVHAAVRVLAGLPVPEEGSPLPAMAVEGNLRLVRNTAAAGEAGAYTIVTGDPGSEDRTDVTAEKARAVLLERYKREVVGNGHFWVDAPLSGDGLTQLGLALGCSVALWGLLVAAALYLRRRRWLYVGLALWVALLVFISAAGIVQLH